MRYTLALVPMMILVFVSYAQVAAKETDEDVIRSIPARVGAFQTRPYIRYLTPDSAEVLWDTFEAAPSAVEFGLGDGPRIRVEDPAPTQRHRLVLTNLKVDTEYSYQAFAGTEAGNRYYFDTTFNYTPVAIPEDSGLFADDTQARFAQAAKAILEAAGVDRGYCVVVGFGEGRLAYELARQSQFTILGFDTDPARVQQARGRFADANLYGTRLTVRAVDSYDKLPVASDLANLVVSETAVTEGVFPGSQGELARILRPAGGKICLATSDGKARVLEERGPLEGAGSWTHQYAEPGNTTNSGDTLKGAARTDEMLVQWVGRPGADFGLDRNPRMPAPLAVNGRLFHQGLNKMVGMDLYNGSLKWLLEIPALRRVNLPRDCSNWCADDGFIYTAIEENCWKIDAETGDRVGLYPLPFDGARDTHDWGYVARANGLLYGSAVRKGSIYIDFFGKAEWYDGTSGPGTFKVCSDTFFACDPVTGEKQWEYRNGAIINPTICIGDGKVLFIASRNGKVKTLETGRIEDEGLWLDQYLVALDAATGKVLWEVPVDTEDGIAVFFMAYTQNTILVESSLNGSYYLYGFSGNDGARLWETSHNWQGDNHSGHMQHLTVVGDLVFVEPNGYNLKTGAFVTDQVGAREGCATYAATQHALLYRGTDRRIAMWDIVNNKTTSWPNLRPSCWLSMVPSGGMILIPEGGAGCSCGTWLETSLAFAPNMK